ncbi:MAG: DUF2815 family protein [Alphaproteobacteria bacterium]|nr:DUF2815 family protein [Alphaproteobacteria bacterium]
MADNDMIMIGGVRISFPHLFQRPIINGEEGKCGAALMLDPEKHAKAIAQIEEGISALCKEKLKGRKLPSDKLCLRDGADKGRTEYEGYQILSANSKGKPLVIGGDGSTVISSEEDSPIYAGCYVNAKVRLWAQDNKFGKRINSELVAVQFFKDGEPLDGSYVSAEDAMSGFGGIDGANDNEDGDDFLAA